jgi:hypothetical protein
LLNGNLFTRDFLVEGIRDTDAWGALDDAYVNGTRRRVEGLFTAFTRQKRPASRPTRSR